MNPIVLPVGFLKKDLGVAETVTVITLASVTAAALFNFGFFAPMEWSYVSLLSIPDLLTGTLIFAVPVAFALFGIAAVDRHTSAMIEIVARRGRPMVVALMVFWLLVVVLITVLTFYFMYPFFPLAAGIDGYGILFVVVLLLNRKSRRDRMALYLAGMSFLYIPIAAGFASVLMLATGAAHPQAEIQSENGVDTGTIIRTTNGYIFLRTAGAVKVLPLSRVKAITTFDPKVP